MAARKKKNTEEENKVVDLISLLAPPNNPFLYDYEIVSLTEKPLIDKQPISSNLSKSTLAQDDFELSKIKKSITKPTPFEQTFTTPPDDSLENIFKEVSVCQKCPLYQTRTKAVPGKGAANAKLMLIGEAPGADEDITGEPFVGKAGKHLDKILEAAGFVKEELFICNILKCRPPNNRDPNYSEMNNCAPYLMRQIALIKPKLIGCLGNIATKFMIGANSPGITKIRGQWFNTNMNIPLMPLYHPSYLVRSASREKGSPNWQMWQDIQKLKAKYDA